MIVFFFTQKFYMRFINFNTIFNVLQSLKVNYQTKKLANKINIFSLS